MIPKLTDEEKLKLFGPYELIIDNIEIELKLATEKGYVQGWWYRHLTEQMRIKEKAVQDVFDRRIDIAIKRGDQDTLEKYSLDIQKQNKNLR